MGISYSGSRKGSCVRTPLREPAIVLSSHKTMAWSSLPSCSGRPCEISKGSSVCHSSFLRTSDSRTGHGIVRLDPARPSRNWNPIVSRCVSKEVASTFFVRALREPSTFLTSFSLLDELLYRKNRTKTKEEVRKQKERDCVHSS